MRQGERMKCFVDKNKNLNHGLEYYATGKATVERPPCESGKEILVEYINPFGEYLAEWRRHDEIEMFEINDNYLKWALQWAYEK